MEIVSLPVGGMITRIAWGRTTRRITCGRPMPRAWAASVWPCSTEMIPARTISAMYAASLRPSPRMTARKGEMILLVVPTHCSEVKGIPILIVDRMEAMLNQKKIWTSTGVPRKNQM